MSYLDLISKTSRPRKTTGSDDEEEGPPPDPDEPVPDKPVPKKEKKVSSSTAKEVTVTARRAGGDTEDLGGLSTLRRDMIGKRRKEREEPWQPLKWNEEGVCHLNPTLVEILADLRLCQVS